VQAACQAPNVSSPEPGPSRLAHSNPPPRAILARHVSRILILYECAKQGRFPTVEELLQLMDNYRPDVRLTYRHLLEEFQNSGLRTITDVYSRTAEQLAPLGGMGVQAAHRIRAYCRDQLLDPLHVLSTDSSDGTASVSDLGQGIRPGKQRRISKWAEEVKEEVKEEEVKDAEEVKEDKEVKEDEEVIEEVEEVGEERAETIVGTDYEDDDGSDDGDMATYVSQEI
jgi:hypothetical protein